MRSRTLALTATLAAAVMPGLAEAEDFAPLDAPGPALSVAAADLARSLRCTDGVRAAARTPVLLLSGTALDSTSMYGWNAERALAQRGIPYCASDQAGELRRNMDDLQTRGEYVTYAIRTMHAMAGRRIAVVGHSQGGMIARWSLRFWPETRAMVEDVVGVAADNHGTATGRLTCPAGCSAALRQQTPEARFIVALNSRTETFAGIDYTEIYSHLDLFVTPSADDTGTSSLHGPGRITNVAVQDVCPTSTPDHLLIGTVDPVAWALTIDALEHDGPADPTRPPASICAQLLMPGVDPVSGPAQLVAAAAYFAASFAYPYVPAEPSLRCYVTASCPAAPTPRPHCRSRRVITVHLDRRLQRAVRATLDDRPVRVRRRGGRRVVVVDLRGRRRGTATLRVVGRGRGGRVVRQIRRFATCAPRH